MPRPRDEKYPINKINRAKERQADLASAARRGDELKDELRDHPETIGMITAYLEFMNQNATVKVVAANNLRYLALSTKHKIFQGILETTRNQSHEYSSVLSTGMSRIKLLNYRSGARDDKDGVPVEREGAHPRNRIFQHRVYSIMVHEFVPLCASHEIKVRKAIQKAYAMDGKAEEGSQSTKDEKAERNGNVAKKIIFEGKGSVGKTPKTR